ncbi:MAG: cytochrome P450 [Pseudonocardiaceae bacterium]
MESTAIQRVTTPTGDPAWLVTNYDDVKALLSDPRLGRSHADPKNAARVSRSAIFGGPMGDPSTEAADHARTRRLLAPAFSARRMAKMRPRVGEIITELLDAMARQTQPVDLHEAVSFPLPALVICELLGVPYADREEFRRWSDDAAHLTDGARSQAGLAKLWEYMHVLVKRKQAQPGDDVVSELAAAVAADPELTDDRIAGLCAGLLFAGHETTVTAIDRGVLLLLTHPQQADELRGDPALIEPAVEEMLRSWMPMRTFGTAERVAGLPRYANADFTFGGVTVRTGELVMLGLHSANLDEQRFPEPDRFDMHRPSNPHMTFGHGPRFCVGAPLARIELQMLFPAILSRFPTLRLAVPIESLRGRDELLTGGLVELPVTW